MNNDIENLQCFRSSQAHLRLHRIDKQFNISLSLLKIDYKKLYGE